MNRSVGVISLGCSKNLVDTEHMLAYLKEAGFNIVDKPDEAQVLIVNTCGFILPAKEESIDTILELAEYKKKGSCQTLVVTGCLVERHKDELAELIPEIDIAIGVHEYEKLPSLLLRGEYAVTRGKRLLSTPFYTAYLRIADGCDNRCTYCAIPSIRGKYKSEPMEKLIAEANELILSGVSELSIIAQDTSAYGLDIYGKPMLYELMEQLSALDGLHWLRALYTYPDTVDEALLSLMCQKQNITNYLDMPLQHINDDMLRRMNRRSNRAHIEGLYAFIRKNAPDFIIRTTFMVGFPGETDAQFDELLSFIKDHPFDRLGGFMFSAEQGTIAATLPGQIDEEKKRERLDTLMNAQKDISLKLNQARVNTETEALITSVGKGFALARSYAQAPEVDGHIKLKYKQKPKVGTYERIKLTNAGIYDMEGLIV